MELTDDLGMKKETIKIEGDRNLYNYTFALPDEVGNQPTPAQESEGSNPA